MFVYWLIATRNVKMLQTFRAFHSLNVVKWITLNKVRNRFSSYSRMTNTYVSYTRTISFPKWHKYASNDGIICIANENCVGTHFHSNYIKTLWCWIINEYWFSPLPMQKSIEVPNILSTLHALKLNSSEYHEFFGKHFMYINI